MTVAKDEALSSLHIGPRHVELDVDVAQTYVAQKVCSVLQGFAPGLVIDLGFIIEGTDGEADDVTMGSSGPMLPEQLLCVARLVRARLLPCYFADTWRSFAWQDMSEYSCALWLTLHCTALHCTALF